MNLKLFETKPRWIGAPKICTYENLPSFKDIKSAKKFLEDQNPSASFLIYWLCIVCEHYHFHPTSTKSKSYITPKPRHQSVKIESEENTSIEDTKLLESNRKNSNDNVLKSVMVLGSEF